MEKALEHLKYGSAALNVVDPFKANVIGPAISPAERNENPSSESPIPMS
jgi:hypothetical protein